MLRPKAVIFEEIHPEGVLRLQEFCDVHVCVGAGRELILEQSRLNDIIVVKSVTQVNKELLDQAQNLKIVARAGTGLDNIDVMYAKGKGIKVLSVPTGNTVSAAEFTVMMILALYKRLPEVIASVGHRDFRRILLEGREISNSTIGVIGLGNIGEEVVKKLSAFNVKLKGWDINPERRHVIEKWGGTFVTTLEDVVKDSDLITLHANLNDQSKGMINAELLRHLNPGTMLVNCARGGLAVENDVLWALEEGFLGFYATDLVIHEPPYDKTPEQHHYQHPFLNHPKILFTPHIAASTKEAQKFIANNLIEQIKSAIR